MSLVSYEGRMLEKLKMPSRAAVEQALLISLFNHGGTVKEFSSGEGIVSEIANDFSLTEEQQDAYLETIYKKENRIKRSSLWHRLLFRAADSLAKQKLVSRPSQTIHLNNKREWMLTEGGLDVALSLLKIPESQKEFLTTKSYEVQKIVKKLTHAPSQTNYSPFDNEVQRVKVTRNTLIRTRGFRQAVIEVYDYKCAFCGLKINSPDAILWEVEAAHIVPHSSKGKDDIWNAVALCRLHHWTFDVGWLTMENDFTIKASSKIESIPRRLLKNT